MMVPSDQIEMRDWYLFSTGTPRDFSPLGSFLSRNSLPQLIVRNCCIRGVLLKTAEQKSQKRY